MYTSGDSWWHSKRGLTAMKWYSNGMKTTIDAAGRVVIPKQVRDLAGLEPGAEVTVEFSNGKIQLEPASKPVKVVRKGSSFVLRAPKGTPPLTIEKVNEILERVRNREL
jgi:AbrB family looped-hinge helix DNA binding protein